MTFRFIRVRQQLQYNNVSRGGGYRPFFMQKIRADVKHRLLFKAFLVLMQALQNT